jgi:hypothetical protein
VVRGGCIPLPHGFTEDGGGDEGDGHDSNGGQAVVIVRAQVVGEGGQGAPEVNGHVDDQDQNHHHAQQGLRPTRETQTINGQAQGGQMAVL